MKPHPRVRKMVKWGGAGVTVLLVVVWIGSAWLSVGWRSVSCFQATVSRGCLVFDQLDYRGPIHIAADGLNGTTHSVYQIPTGWRLGAERSGTLTWGGVWGMRGNLQTWWTIPLWPVAAASLLLTMLAFRFDAFVRRRDGAKLCSKCGYDRAGLVAGAVCPECGTGA